MKGDLKKEIEEKLYSRNFTRWGLDLNPFVSVGVGVIILLFSVISLIDLETTTRVLNDLKTNILNSANWFYCCSNLIITTNKI